MKKNFYEVRVLLILWFHQPQRTPSSYNHKNEKINAHLWPGNGWKLATSVWGAKGSEDRAGTSMTIIVRNDHSGRELSVESRERDIHDTLSVSVCKPSCPKEVGREERRREEERQRERGSEKRGRRKVLTTSAGQAEGNWGHQWREMYTREGSYTGT